MTEQDFRRERLLASGLLRGAVMAQAQADIALRRMPSPKPQITPVPAVVAAPPSAGNTQRAASPAP